MKIHQISLTGNCLSATIIRHGTISLVQFKKKKISSFLRNTQITLKKIINVPEGGNFGYKQKRPSHDKNNTNYMFQIYVPIFK